uniref:Uncharacterized protein n=1 Tax=Glossina austeni TaxID=7395 RepID=A0A1A9UVX1_GLOAU
MTKQDIKHVINDDSDKLVLVYLTSGGALKLTRSSFGLELGSTFMVYKCHQNCNSIRVSKCHTISYMYYWHLHIFISVVVMSLWHDRLFGGCIEWVFWFAANGQQYCHRPHCPFAGHKISQRVCSWNIEPRKMELKRLNPKDTSVTTLHVVELGFAVDLNGLCRMCDTYAMEFNAIYLFKQDK